MAKDFLLNIKKTVMNKGVRIIYSEGEDSRILTAVSKVNKEKIATPILLGNPETIKKLAKQLKINVDNIQIINPLSSPNLNEYAKEFYNLRKNKGLTEKQAMDSVKKTNYFGTMMLHSNQADGLISGAVYTTAETVRPALQIIKTKKEFNIASSFFIMLIKEKIYFFADCGINRDPSAEELSEIAINTASSAEHFGIKPKVALLSFSTHGSAEGHSVDKVRKAAAIAKKKRPDLLIDGEMQLDAAIVPEIAKRKCPSSQLEGQANILIFPNLDAGNIGYKLVEHLSGAKAIGPIIQGLKKPVNDLSRGCNVEDIVNVSAITAFTIIEDKK
ncbi:phosphate acetyltransferase [Candidatus Pacearchaeota archaeon]|nr:phosphate acetyltransferase [Candidatus Pacearchaeota archaeon]